MDVCIFVGVGGSGRELASRGHDFVQIEMDTFVEEMNERINHTGITMLTYHAHSKENAADQVPFFVYYLYYKLRRFSTQSSKYFRPK